MRTKIVETGNAISQPRRSKYNRLLAATVESLRRDGADSRLRAIEDTAAWSPGKLRRMTRGLRFHYRTHRVRGFKLSLRTCVLNGLCFLWVKTAAKETGKETKT
jgi:hypothetical protein